MRLKPILFLSLVVIAACLLMVLGYNLPPIHDRLAWRVENLRTQIKYAMQPPQEAIFIPQEQVAAIVNATLTASAPTVTASPTSEPTATRPGPTATPPPSPTATLTPPPTLTPTPIPARVELKGIRHEYQQYNNCGPATLAMALSFWGWQKDQRETRAYLRPNFKDVDDKNVFPAEMVDYVQSQTGLKALVRVGGDPDMLKRLLAAGFPVIIETGFQPPKEDWMGHYMLFNGYDDSRGKFIAQDAYIMPDLPVPYDKVAPRWRDFNDVYMVVYPPEREAEVLAVLGPQADETENYRYAAQKAEQDINSLAVTGRDLFFTWYNLGSSRVELGDYAGAAQAYDQAFALYPRIEEKDRPWRMLWYQVGPYLAYYHTGRYQDLANLATTTLAAMVTPVLEESFYWRGMARAALGNTEGAIHDFRQAASLNSRYAAPRDELQRLGVQYP